MFVSRSRSISWSIFPPKSLICSSFLTNCSFKSPVVSFNSVITSLSCPVSRVLSCLVCSGVSCLVSPVCPLKSLFSKNSAFLIGSLCPVCSASSVPSCLVCSAFSASCALKASMSALLNLYSSVPCWLLTFSGCNKPRLMYRLMLFLLLFKSSQASKSVMLKSLIVIF